MTPMPENDVIDATWALTGEQKKQVKSEMSDYAKALIAALIAAIVDNVPDLALEGAEWGGGTLTDEAVVKQIAAVINSQEEYAADFLKDVNDRVTEVLAEEYATQDAFVNSILDTFEWAKSRAESYAVGSGI